MGIGRMSVGIISRSRGQSALASSAYRSGEKLDDKRLGKMFDYSRKSKIDYSVIMLPENAPEKLKDREYLWNEVEAKENRKDAQLARDFTISCLIELTPEQNKELVIKFVQEELIDMGMIADVNFHDLKSHNPHAHIMATMRNISNDGFGNKNRSWNHKNLLKRWRNKWEEKCNQVLSKYGHEERISMKKDINKIPQRKLGSAAAALEQRGIETYIGNKNRIIKQVNDLNLVLKNKDLVAFERVLKGWKKQQILGENKTTVLLTTKTKNTSTNTQVLCKEHPSLGDSLLMRQSPTPSIKRN